MWVWGEEEIVGGGGWSGLRMEELTEVTWELRVLAMDDGLFELKDDQFSGGAEEAVAVFQM